MRDKGRGPVLYADRGKKTVINSVKVLIGAVLIASGFLFFTFVGTVKGQDTEVTDAEQHRILVEEEQQKELKTLFTRTVKYKTLTDKWVHRRNEHHKFAHKPLTWTDSIRYANTRANQWRLELTKQKKITQLWLAEQRQWNAKNREFDVALRAAADRYGVSYNHLHSCAYSEGHIHGYRYSNGVPQKHRGIDPFEMNHSGSDAGGWAQFMPSTFKNNSYKIRKAVPEKYIQWKSRVGQAYLMAYMFKTGGSGQWYGAGC